jgi:hypothetical protein
MKLQAGKRKRAFNYIALLSPTIEVMGKYLFTKHSDGEHQRAQECGRHSVHNASPKKTSKFVTKCRLQHYSLCYIGVQFGV